MAARKVCSAAILLLSFSLSSFAAPSGVFPSASTPRLRDDFRLFHVLQHGVMEDSHMFREGPISPDNPAVANIRTLSFYADPEAGEAGAKAGVKLIPDPTNKQTVLNLAEMAENAYYRNTSADWTAVPGYNISDEFGWDSNGLQGYIFGNSDRSILVMSIKGTTFKFFGEGGTSANDRLMDNLMFSCCCARVDSSWDPVCNCYSGGNTCNQTCLNTRMRASDTYYYVAREMYQRVRAKFPKSEIWFTGHSLGGALASLLAAAHDLSAFTYEAPGDLLYGLRIGLNILRDQMQKYSIFHFGNDSDPIFLGKCQGRASTCSLFSYAMETICHIGSTCTYDGGFLTNINNHRIEVCINSFFTPDPVPVCIPENNCRECTNWTFA